MTEIKINLANLTESEKEQALMLANKSNKGQTELFKVGAGKLFEIAGIEFIKFSDEDGETTAVTKDMVFASRFGNNNNLAKSDVLKQLQDEVLPKIERAIGSENICDIHTDLTTLDGLKPYEVMISKISLPTFDFYRENVEIFDKYKLDEWWWLATPESARPHSEPNWISCVSPSGYVGNNYYNNIGGVRPLLRFKSSILVSCEE